MAKSKKKKYKKKKNPNRAPQKQNSVARTQSAPSAGQATDPKRQRQMWIALAIAVGVFLLLILVARLANRSDNQDAETTPETETVESGGEVTGSGDETEAVEDADAQDNDAADADTADTEQAADTTDDVTTTAQNNAAGTTDNADTTAATNDNADTTAQSTATNDSTTTTTAQDNAAATTTNDAAATETASLQSADTETPAAEQYADILVQDYGKITVKLDSAAAPITVKNFTDLANDGFYNGLTFHRIMDGFMMQGGDPLGNGFGGSDENIVGEFAANGYANPLSHTRGAISMARGGDMNSASSQFFIVQSDSTFLDGSYAAFGYVTSGMEIVDKICKDAKPTDDNGSIPPDEQPIIESIIIREQ